MKRKIFFFLDSLHISKKERIAIKTLMLFVLILSIIKPYVSSKANYDPEEYEKLRYEFAKRAELMKQKEQAFLAKFEADTSLLKPITTKSKVKSAALDSTNKININIAKLEDLMKLPGIGKAYAERIIEFRNTNGNFKNVEELIKIKGIGASRLQKLKPYISVQ